jgi:hypothetical protein
MGGGAPGGGQPRKPINITTVWDAIRGALGEDADRSDPGLQNHHKHHETPKNTKKTQSLIQ